MKSVPVTVADLLHVTD